MIMGDDRSKFCTSCKRVLPATEYHRNRAKSDGLQVQCKSCHGESICRYREKKKLRPRGIKAHSGFVPLADTDRESSMVGSGRASPAVTCVASEIPTPLIEAAGQFVAPVTVGHAFNEKNPRLCSESYGDYLDRFYRWVVALGQTGCAGT